MKKVALIISLFLVVHGIINGQSVLAPTSGTYSLNTSNQATSGFSVSGFNAGDNLLVSIGLINPPSGTTLRLSNTSNITASVGYNLSGNFTRISFTGNQENVNTVLSSLQVNTGSTAGAINITVSATVNPPGYYYLPSTGHFYKPVTWPTEVTGGAEAYTTIKNLAASESFKGQTGYLVTITSQDEQDFIHANVPINNILIALTDEVQEGIWKWDAGPEAGNVVGPFINWCGGEPNNAGTGENYVVTNWGDPIGNCWNDYGPPGSDFSSTIMGGYVVEFGIWTNPADQNFAGFYSGSVSHQSYPPNPTGITATFSAICNGNSTQLTATGIQGTVYWYTGSCGGTATSPATGNQLTVSPLVTTTYYARNQEGGNFSTGCAEITITVEPAPVSGTLSKTPDVASICQGNSVSATLSAGSGGNGIDELEYRTNNGSAWSSWSAYTSGSSISTSGLTNVEIQTRRTASTCTSAGYNTVTWSVNPLQQFRSKNGSNWTTPANWDQYNGTTWVAATSYPGAVNNDCANPQVTILAGHQMEIQAGSNINIPNLEIKALGKVTIKSGGKLTVSNILKMDKSAGAAIITEQ